MIKEFFAKREFMPKNRGTLIYNIISKHKDDYDIYGIEISLKTDKKLESDRVYISDNRNEVEKFIEKLVVNEVTPISLVEIADDFMF